MDSPKISETIKAKRRERELTQEELAGMLGVTKAAVSKWETAESYPDITLLPQIAQLFHITMDELFGYSLEFKPLKIVNQYHAGFSLADLDDLSVLDHGTIKECVLKKADDAGEWEVRVQMISNENDFPYTMQKCLKPKRLIDMYSYRLADGKIIDDHSPNKHYICREKMWEYHTSNKKYMFDMFKEQVAMGLLNEDDIY